MTKRTKALAVASNETYDALAEEITATFTERIFVAREEVIRAHHETGKLLTEFVAKNDVKITLLVKYLADRGVQKETTLWLSHQFYQRFPKLGDIDALGHGKNISWNKIRLALAGKAEPCGHASSHHVDASECDDCGKIIVI